LAENLAELCGQFPDLETIIKKWPQLSEEIKKTIIKIIGASEKLSFWFTF
jgi:hypothetical protein